MLLTDWVQYSSVKVEDVVLTLHDYVMALMTAWTGATRRNVSTLYITIY